MPNPRYDLIVFEKFTAKGKTKYKPHRVGSAVYTTKSKAYTLFIPPGVSITGRVLMLPEKAAKEMTEIDLIEAYQSAADDYGV